MTLLARIWGHLAPRLTERNLALLLVISFIGMSAWIMAVPYDAMRMDLADATTNEIWSDLIREGKYAIPIEEWRARGYPPTQSSVVELDGHAYVVNEKGPGHAMLVAVLDTMGLGGLTGTLCAGLAVMATYMLGRRLFNWKVGFLAAIFIMTNLTVIVMWQRYLWTDASTMHFLVLGVWLLAESMHLFRRGEYEGKRNLKLGAFAVGLMGGLAFGLSISTRYPVALVLGPMLLYIVACNAYLKKGTGFGVRGTGSASDQQVAAAQRTWTNWTGPQRRGTGDGARDAGYGGREARDNVKTAIKVLAGSARDAAPFLLGLLMVLAPLMQYDTTYFGGPLRSGYDAVSLMDYTRTGNLSERNQSVQWSANWADGAANVWSNSFILTPILLARMPILLLVPFSAVMLRRRPEFWLLVPWAIVVFATYLSLPWVKMYANAQEIVWEPRYFMPALPALALLATCSLDRISLGDRSDGRKVLFGATVAAIIVLAGVIPAESNFKQMREGEYQTPRGPAGPPGGPGQPANDTPGQPGTQFQDVNLSELISQPVKYAGSFVRLADITVRDVVYPSVNVTDGALSVTVRLEDFPSVPSAASPGEKVTVRGPWSGQDRNGNGRADQGEFFLNVKYGTTDRFERAG